MDQQVRLRVLPAVSGIIGGIAIALITIVCLRYGIAVSENARLFAGVILILSAILVAFSFAILLAVFAGLRLENAIRDAVEKKRHDDSR